MERLDPWDRMELAIKMFYAGNSQPWESMTKIKVGEAWRLIPGWSRERQEQKEAFYAGTVTAWGYHK